MRKEERIKWQRMLVVTNLLYNTLFLSFFEPFGEGEMPIPLQRSPS